MQKFKGTDEVSLRFYEDQGFVCHSILEHSFLDLVDEAFKYYSESSKPKSVAFRNADGIYKHIVDIFRDRRSPSLDLFLSEEMQRIINFYLKKDAAYIFTHSKMSFKQPYAKSNWMPHQDNGYKIEQEERDGFAVFLCLEDMNSTNGAIQVFPESHKLGLLAHDKVIENNKLGDHQYFINELPQNLKPLLIEARRGDLVIFHANLIHQSTSSSSDSKRLAIIAEIEEWDSLKLDDYSKKPILSNGDSLSAHHSLKLSFKSFLSKQYYMNKISDYEKLIGFVRNLKKFQKDFFT